MCATAHLEADRWFRPGIAARIAAEVARQEAERLGRVRQSHNKGIARA